MSTAPALSFVAMRVHIGQAIDDRRKELGMSKTDFATRIKRDRTWVYDLFKAYSVDTLLLETICDVLQFNFFKTLSDDYADRKGLVADPQAPYVRMKPGKSGTMRVVIEVDSSDKDAQEAAVRMAQKLAQDKP